MQDRKNKIKLFQKIWTKEKFEPQQALYVVLKLCCLCHRTQRILHVIRLKFQLNFLFRCAAISVILLFKAPYVTSVLVIRSCYASGVMLESLPPFGWHHLCNYAHCHNYMRLSPIRRITQSHLTSTVVTYSTLNNKIKWRHIETVNLTEISVELDSSAPCVYVYMYNNKTCNSL